MTIGELKRLLNKFSDDMEVVKSSQSGDYWGTQIVSDIRKVTNNICVYSNYHEAYKISDDIYSDDKTKEFVIL